MKGKTIGIVGGGQLGRMTILEARKMGFTVHVLTPEHPSPASDIADNYIVGSLTDPQKIRELSRECDILTYEIEHIGVETLKEVEADGKRVVPSAHVLEIIQDKSRQKALFHQKGLPVSDWTLLTPENQEQKLKDFGYPVVQKACSGGYDGKGVFILKGPEDVTRMIEGPSFLEEYIPFEKEVAVMAARNSAGEMRTYPMVEMEFDPETNICDITLVPSAIPQAIQTKARELASAAVEALQGVGIFGVEMFLTREGDILINEVAPRPHNSGHYTIEGCYTSQYEQFLRALLNLPLGSTQLLKPNVMINLLGSGRTGPVQVAGLEEALKIEGVNVHIYGKPISKPHRKMGHITALADSLEEARERAQRAKKLITITGGEK